MIDLRIHGIGDYELLTNVNVQVNGWTITVYKGFRYNGANIPQILWDDIGCPLDYALESLFHDALYRSRLLDRKTSDKIFHALLSRRDDVSMVTAKAMYLGVRFGGESAYEQAKEDMASYRDYVYVMPIEYDTIK